VEDLVPKLLPLSTLQRVLQGLLEEGVHIRDMRTIIEVLAEHAPRSQDVNELTSAVRIALGRAIIHSVYPGVNELQVMVLDPALEQILMQMATAKPGEGAGLEPGLAENLVGQAQLSVQQQEQLGLPPVLLVPAPLRELLSRFLRRAIPQLRVVSHAEVPDTKVVKVTSVIGSNT